MNSSNRHTYSEELLEQEIFLKLTLMVRLETAPTVLRYIASVKNSQENQKLNNPAKNLLTLVGKLCKLKG